RLLLDALNGNSTLFIHRDEVKAAWTWVDPIIEHWKNSETSPELYSAGTWGPSKSNKIFDSPHQYWHDVNK
ncbi:MAG: glucose-6-phosphate 1-dehydrogenase, partial [Enterobacterales bacterium]